jgi:hypothetical protein
VVRTRIHAGNQTSNVLANMDFFLQDREYRDKMQYAYKPG